MAGDWIKMRTDLYRDPKVCKIADSLIDPDGDLAKSISNVTRCDMSVTSNVMRNVTVGALVTVWGVARQRGKRVEDDLIIKHSSLSILDYLTDLPGFGEAMATVGWVVQTDEGLVFPRFFEDFNVDPHEELKRKNAERQKRFRENNREENSNVTVTLNSNAREEKRREENKKDKIHSRPPSDPSKPGPEAPTTSTQAEQASTAKKPLPRKTTEHRLDPRFNQFWEAYPRKRKKEDSAKAFAQLDPTPELFETILKAIELWKKTEQWSKHELQFIPYPASWLRGKRWEDDLSNESTSPPQPTTKREKDIAYMARMAATAFAHVHQNGVHKHAIAE